MSDAILLSGGMDSIALAYWKRPILAITLDYGQLAAEAEIDASTAVAHELCMDHEIIKIDLRALGSGDMAGTNADRHAPASDWWPYRNQMLVTLAAMKAVTLGVNQLMLGMVVSDQAHRDGTVEFIDKLDVLLACQEGGLRVTAPAIGLSTSELILTSRAPRSLMALAHSCHKANVPCGQCRGCNKYFETLNRLEHVAAERA
ncbi:7-cyano-7-deazaguanine synthase [Xanthomonas sp. NCPPB 1638]|uniref:7-cyano-7-deazaguanine synthase n=1 Tax=Xanthomonas TaxID=338 RepID=UPI00132EB84C|nr:7-cyano-7-deazaguanine synthase [Xanthomonas cucurbitae]QHG88233.1 7-cyano-7-deazaguanine synthase [Xanthomonas cucurbitae]WDM74798.1 7-cyano-7-deazaguanine synthase [Xanthomonas cucurbitae]